MQFTISGKKEICVIYLDQFATSGMFESHSPQWKKIRKLVMQGVRQDKFICPASPEHYIETSQKDSNKAKALDSEMFQLTKGFCFKPEVFITSQQIISLIRKNNLTLQTFMYKDCNKNVLSQPENLQHFKKTKSQLERNISESTNLINQMRSSGNVRIKKEQRDQLISAHKAINKFEFIDRLQELLAKNHLYIRGVEFKSGDVPHWIDQLIYQLLTRHRMTTKEAKKLLSELKDNGFDNIPTLDIRTSLTAFFSAHSKKETVNDHIDLIRLSTGLPVSDILLTDKQRKHEILELALDKKYCTTVYSGKSDDLVQFISMLSEKLAHASKDEL